MARSRAMVLLLAWLANVLIATRSAIGARDEEDFNEPGLEPPAPIIPDLEAECKEWVVVGPNGNPAPNGTTLSECNEATPCSLQSVFTTLEAHENEQDGEICVKAKAGEYIIDSRLAQPSHMRLLGRDAVLRCTSKGGMDPIAKTKGRVHIDGLQLIGCEGFRLDLLVKQALVTLKNVKLQDMKVVVTVLGVANTFIIAHCTLTTKSTIGLMFGALRVQGRSNRVFLHATKIVGNSGVSGISVSGPMQAEGSRLINQLHVLDGSLIAKNGGKSKARAGISIFGNGTAVTIRDSTIRSNYGHGIHVLSKGAELNLQNVSLATNTYHGILFSKAHSAKCNIKDSSVMDHTGVGIYLQDSKDFSLDVQTTRVENNVGSGVKVSQNDGGLKLSLQKTTLRSNGIAGLHVSGSGSAQQVFNLTDVAILEQRSCGIISKSVHSQWRLSKVEATRNAGGGVRLRADLESAQAPPVLEVEVDHLNATANSGHALELRGCLECARNQATARNLVLRNNVDGLAISMNQAEFEDVNIIGSWRAVWKEGKTGSARLQNVQVMRCGIGVEVEGGGKFDVGNLTLMRNEQGVKVNSNSSIQVRDVMARQNHVAFEAEVGANLGLDGALITDNVKGIRFTHAALINISQDSFVYLNEMHDIQCDITTANSGPWLQRALSWLQGSWRSCSPGYYSWTTWVLAVPHNRIKTYIIGLAICCCLALNLPLILADKAAKDAKVQKSDMKKASSRRFGDGAAGATDSMSLTLASAASMLGRPNYKEALKQYVRTLKAFYVLAGLLTFMLVGCMLWLVAAFCATWDTYGELMADEGKEFRFIEGRGMFFRCLVKDIGVIFLLGGSLWLALQSLRQQRITLKDAWSALKKDSVDTKERLRQQLLSHSQ